MDEKTLSQFEDDCMTILDSKDTDGFAKAYAKAGLDLRVLFPPEEMEDAVKVQCLYILNNLGKWRGEEAREVKSRLKKISKNRRN